MAGKVDELSIEVGKLIGALAQHIKACEREWAEADNDRRTSATYRQEVRGTLSTLTDAVAKIEPLAKRVEKIDGDDKTSLKSRLATVEAKAALAAVAIGGLGTFIVIGVKEFGTEIKAFVYWLLKFKTGS